MRVLRIHFGPRDKGQTHEHILNRVVLYLNDQTPPAKADGSHGRRRDARGRECLRSTGPGDRRRAQVALLAGHLGAARR